VTVWPEWPSRSIKVAPFSGNHIIFCWSCYLKLQRKSTKFCNQQTENWRLRSPTADPAPQFWRSSREWTCWNFRKAFRVCQRRLRLNNSRWKVTAIGWLIVGFNSSTFSTIKLRHAFTTSLVKRSPSLRTLRTYSENTIMWEIVKKLDKTNKRSTPKNLCLNLYTTRQSTFNNVYYYFHNKRFCWR